MADLTSLKADIDDLNVDKLKSLPVYLFKLSNWVENEAAKKNVYHELIKNFMYTDYWCKWFSYKSWLKHKNWWN